MAQGKDLVPWGRISFRVDKGCCMGYLLCFLEILKNSLCWRLAQRKAVVGGFSIYITLFLGKVNKQFGGFDFALAEEFLVYKIK